MPSIKAKLKPTVGFSHFVHIGLTALLPALVFICVRLHFVELAVALILLAKWRMFAVKPRHWPANIRANAVDIIVGLSLLIFMIHSGSQAMQLVWALIYGGWLTVLKPQSSLLGVSLQAMVAQFVGLSAIFINWGDAPLYVLVILGALVCYSAARHFFTSFDEPLTRYLADVWAYFAAALIWVLGHWLLFYGVIAQPTLLLSVIGFSLAGIYYLDQTDRLSVVLRRQVIFVMMAIVLIMLVFSDWGDKAV
ncbi:MAG TPA: hypothetical protein VLF90_04295 [Patescibacteria group bacterium]|nr:hypothetical protein [Patescibacteria group bacterium]